MDCINTAPASTRVDKPGNDGVTVLSTAAETCRNGKMTAEADTELGGSIWYLFSKVRKIVEVVGLGQTMGRGLAGQLCGWRLRIVRRLPW